MTDQRLKGSRDGTVAFRLRRARTGIALRDAPGRLSARGHPPSRTRVGAVLKTNLGTSALQNSLGLSLAAHTPSPEGGHPWGERGEPWNGGSFRGFLRAPRGGAPSRCASPEPSARHRPSAPWQRREEPVPSRLPSLQEAFSRRRCAPRGLAAISKAGQNDAHSRPRTANIPASDSVADAAMEPLSAPRSCARPRA
jgi:hypothetical protein